jgi:hypothetical protein
MDSSIEDTQREIDELEAAMNRAKARLDAARAEQHVTRPLVAQTENTPQAPNTATKETLNIFNFGFIDVPNRKMWSVISHRHIEYVSADGTFVKDVQEELQELLKCLVDIIWATKNRISKKDILDIDKDMELLIELIFPGQLANNLWKSLNQRKRNNQRKTLETGLSGRVVPYREVNLIIHRMTSLSKRGSLNGTNSSRKTFGPTYTPI